MYKRVPQGPGLLLDHELRLGPAGVFRLTEAGAHRKRRGHEASHGFDCVEASWQLREIATVRYRSTRSSCVGAGDRLKEAS